MTEWIKYDSRSRAIESHVKHLIVNGDGPAIAVHAKLLDLPGYGWFGVGGYRINGVTHYAIISPVPDESVTEEKSESIGMERVREKFSDFRGRR